MKFARAMGRILIILCACYATLALIIFFRQRSMLYFPSHASGRGALAPWEIGGRRIGCCQEVPSPRTIWLMMHGNAGQAADRQYVLRRIQPEDALYVLEYPGYGPREGSPCMT